MQTRHEKSTVNESIPDSFAESGIEKRKEAKTHFGSGRLNLNYGRYF